MVRISKGYTASFLIIYQEYSTNSMTMMKVAAVILALWESKKPSIEAIKYQFKTLKRMNILRTLNPCSIS